MLPRDVPPGRYTLLIATGWLGALLWQSLSYHAAAIAVMLLLAIFAQQLPMLPWRSFRAFLLDMPLDLAEPAAEPAPVLAADSADSAQGGADASATSERPAPLLRCQHVRLSRAGTNKYRKRWTCRACGEVFLDNPPPPH